MSTAIDSMVKIHNREHGTNYKPWYGGVEGPADWDQSASPNALWRDATEQKHESPYWTHGGLTSDIIGYIAKEADVANKWGPEIEVNGVMPEWLRDDEEGLFENRPGIWFGSIALKSYDWSPRANDGLGCPISIRLRADHPYYKGEMAEFTPCERTLRIVLDSIVVPEWGQTPESTGRHLEASVIKDMIEDMLPANQMAKSFRKEYEESGCIEDYHYDDFIDWAIEKGYLRRG